MFKKILITCAAAVLTTGVAASGQTGGFGGPGPANTSTPQGNPPVAPAANAGQVQEVTGRFFRFALPAGWQHAEAPMALQMVSPDGNLGVCFAMTPPMPGQIPVEQFLQMALQHSGLPQFQVGQTKVVAEQGGVKIIDAEVTGTRPDQVPFRAAVRAGVSFKNGQTTAFLHMGVARADQWAQHGALVTKLSLAISNDVPQQPQPHGGFNGGHPNNGYPAQGGYEPQGQYNPQNGYPTQNGYPAQGGYPQGGYAPQNGYPTQNGGYAPQPGYPAQGGYAPQGGYQPARYPQAQPFQGQSY
jgi:hypothetical protein